MRALIFLPGYKGSTLKEIQTGKAAWMPISLLFKNERALDLSIDDSKTSVLMEPDGIIKGIPPLVDVYGPLISLLKQLESKSLSVFHFSYDWRQNTLFNVNRLSGFINSFRAQGYKEFNFVCHSMGGSILAYYLRYGCQDPFSIKNQWQECHDVKNAVFCAVPYRGTMRALEYMLVGNPLLLNKKILDARTALTFPVAYEMMPLYDPAAIKSCDTGSPVGLFSEDAWSDYNMGLYRFADVFGRHQVKRFLSIVLPMAKKVLTLVDNPPFKQDAPQSLNVLNLYSDSCSTLREGFLKKGIVSSELIYKNVDLREISPDAVSKARAPGDELVVKESGLHPFKDVCAHFREVNMQFTHQNLFSKRSVKKTILEFILS